MSEALEGGAARDEARDEPRDDWQLLAASAQGDEPAFRELVERHYESAVRFSRQLLGGDEAKAEDIAQQAFLRVHQARSRLQPKAPFRALLFRILLNFVRNDWAKRDRRGGEEAFESTRVAEEADSGVPDPTTGLEHEEVELVLRQALMRLKPDHRAAFWLREREGLNYRDIAEAMEASLPQVKIWIHRARKRLIEILGPYFEEGVPPS